MILGGTGSDHLENGSLLGFGAMYGHRKKDIGELLGNGWGTRQTKTMLMMPTTRQMHETTAVLSGTWWYWVSIGWY